MFSPQILFIIINLNLTLLLKIQVKFLSIYSDYKNIINKLFVYQKNIYYNYK